MPWAKMTYERTVKVYKEVLNDVLSNHHRDIDLTAKELLIRGEILKRDFTKRQMIIIMFILTFSYNYGKEWALIPRLSDFEIAGISKYKIRAEINKLLEMNVIEINEEQNLYRLQEPSLWKAPYNVGYKDERSRELFMLNLKHAGFDVEPMIEKLKEMES